MSISKKQSDFSPTTKFSLVVVVAAVIIFGYFAIQALGDTTINLTLNTNPALEDGLVAHWTFDGSDMDWVTSTTTEAQDRSGNGYHGDVQPDDSEGGGAPADAAAFVSAGGGTGTSFTYDIGSPDNRLLIIMPADENTGTSLSAVTADGKSCNSVQQTTNTFSEGSHIELWYCDEDDLGASNGTVTIALTGADTGWATHVHLYTDVSQTGPGDSGIENSGTNTDTIAIESIDTWEDGVLVMSAGASTQSINFTSWTSPLTERLETPDPDAHTFGSASDVPTVDNTNQTYTATLNQTSGTIAGVIGSWDQEAGAVGETTYTSTTTMVTAGNLGQALSFDGTDEFVDVGNVSTGIQTVAFWLRVSTSTATQRIIDIDGTDQIETDASSVIAATSFPGTTVIYQDGVAGSTTLTSGWHHITVTDTVGVNASDFDIGRIETEGYFGGVIDDVRLYDRVLSKEEVDRLYGLGATTKIALTLESNAAIGDGLKDHWSFDSSDVSGTTITNSRGATNGTFVGAGATNWFNSDYQYCRKFTMTAGGDSGGVATTTTAGFALAASATLSTLAATSSSGNIYETTTTSGTTTPVDVAITDGTDCGSDGGALLDFYFEKYVQTTGEFALWVEANDISSTTAKTVLMYYGYADDSATDQSDEAGTFGALTESSVFNLHENPADTGANDVLDSTSNSYDGTDDSTMDGTDAVPGKIGSAMAFDGNDDDVASSGTLDDVISNSTGSISVWVRPTGTAPSASDPNGGGAVIGTNTTNCSDDGAGGYISISQFNNGGTDRIWVGNYDGSHDVVGLTYTTDEWMHVTWQHAGGNLYGYKNGQLVGSVASGNTTVSNRQLCIGAGRGFGSTEFEGDIDDVRTYKGVLDPMDILTIYNNTNDSSTFWTIGTEETENANIAASSAGRVGQAISFDGSDDYIDVGNAGSGIKSIAFWIKADNVTADAKLIDIDGTDQIETDGSSVITATSFPGTIVIYQDGVAGDTTLGSGWHHIVITDTTGVNASDFDIGRIEGEGLFAGKIDDVRLYTRVLSKNEIIRLYEMGATAKIATPAYANPDLKSGLVGHWTFDGRNLWENATDSSPTGANGKLTNFTSTTTRAGKLGQALEFDGSNDYVDVGESTAFESALPVSVAAWVYFDNFTDDSSIFRANDEDGRYNGYWCEIDNSTQELRAHFGNGGGANSGSRESKFGNTALKSRQWYHVACVIRGADDMDLYIDGVDDGGSYSGTGSTLFYDTTAGIKHTIGIDTGGTDEFFDGRLDDVRVYNRALSKSEIERLYDIGN